MSCVGGCVFTVLSLLSEYRGHSELDHTTEIQQCLL